MPLISNRNRFLIVQVTLTSGPGHPKTPLLADLSVSTSPDHSAPTNHSLWGCLGVFQHTHGVNFQWFLDVYTMKFPLTMVSGGPTTGQLLWLQLLTLSSLLASLQSSRHFPPQLCLTLSHLQTFAYAVPSAKNAASPDLPMDVPFSSFQSPIKHQGLQPAFPATCVNTSVHLLPGLAIYSLSEELLLLFTEFLILCNFLVCLFTHQNICLPTTIQGLSQSGLLCCSYQ